MCWALGMRQSYMKYRFNLRRICHLIFKHCLCFHKWMKTVLSSTHSRPVTSLGSLTFHSSPLVPSFPSLLLPSLFVGNSQAVLREPASTPLACSHGNFLFPFLPYPTFSVFHNFPKYILGYLFTLASSVFLKNLRRVPFHSLLPQFWAKVTIIMTKLSERHLNPK